MHEDDRLNQSDVASIVEEELNRLTPHYSVEKEYLYAVRGGQRLRPFLLYLASTAVGCGGLSQIIPAMLAIELIHKFTLIHDDLIDSDEFRRGQPTFHSVFGPEHAVVVGDMLISLAYEQLGKLANHHSVQEMLCFYRLFNKVMEKLCIGELEDVMSRGRLDMSIEGSLDVAYYKTGSLIEGSMHLGAVIANARYLWIDSLRAYGRQIGLAFQLINDLNNLRGLERNLGRETGTDLVVGTKSATWVYAYSHLLPTDREALVKPSRSSQPTDAEILSAIKCITDSGAADFTSKRVKHYLEQSVYALKDLPESSAKRELCQLAETGFGKWYWQSDSVHV